MTHQRTSQWICARKQMLVWASLVVVFGFAAVVEAAPCSRASLRGKWYYQGIWVNYQADGAGQSTGQDVISVAFNSTNGKVTVKGTNKKVDQNGQTEVEQDDGTGTYTVSQSCIATLTFPEDGNEPDDVVKLRVFPKKGIFVILDQNEQPDEIGLGFGLKAE